VRHIGLCWTLLFLASIVAPLAGQQPAADSAKPEAIVRRADPDLDFQQPNQHAQSFVDGQYITIDPNGNQTVARQDVLQQLVNFKQFRFCRVLAGDTIEKIAQRYQVPAQRIRLLNSIKQGNVFGAETLVCLRWDHQVPRDMTVEQLAKQQKTSVDVLTQLNGFKADAQLKTGQTVQVPAVYRMQLFENPQQKMTVFTVAMPAPEVEQRRVVFDVQRIEMRQYQVKADESLDDIAKANDIDVAMLCKINGLTDKSKLEDEQIIVVRCGVKYHPEQTPLDLVAQQFGTTEQSILKLNGIDDKTKLEADQWLHIPAQSMVRQINARVQKRKANLEAQPQPEGGGF
jgi:LysM repeat protein